MKNKILIFSTFAAALMLTSCSKEDAVNPASPALTPDVENPSQKVMQGTIYGVAWDGHTGVFKSWLYTVNNVTGATSNPRLISNSSPTLDATNVAGISREYGNDQYVIMTAFVSGVQRFIKCDITTTGSTIGYSLLGTIVYSGGVIKDIELNPVDGYTYGISADHHLIRFTSLSPVIYNDLGSLEAVGGCFSPGSGPYAITFDPFGNCNIFTGRTYQRAYVDYSGSGPHPTVIGLYPGLATPQAIATESAAILCAGSPGTYYIFIGAIGSGGTKYYKWVGGSLGYSYLSNNCLADYTHFPYSDVH